MTGPTPLLDFFKRGEVAPDVRLLAAQGAIAPRAHEQLAILVLLVDDADAVIRETADATLRSIPEATLKVFLARSDVPIDLREFFADRGIFPDVMPENAVLFDEDAPLIEMDSGPEIDTLPDAEASSGDDEASRVGLTQQLAAMSFPQRLRSAVKGSREMRAVLIRDPNKMISAAVLSSPKVTDQEVESFAKMANVGEDVLRIIGSTRAWTKNYGVVAGLVRNPKTPLALSMNMLSRLNEKDVQLLSMDRNIPGALRTAARKKTMEGTSRR